MRASSVLHQMGGAAPRPRPVRTFEGINFRKADGALKLRVMHPKFRAVGKMGILHSVSSDGSVAVSVIPALPASPAAGGEEQSTKYDWESAVVLNLTAADVVTLVQSPIMQPMAISQKFANSTTGRVSVKKIEIAPVGAPPAAAGKAPAGPASFTLTVTEEGRSATMTLPQTELFLLRNLLGLSLPWITGWQMQLDPGAFDPSIHLSSSSATRPAPAAGGDGDGYGGEGDGGDGGCAAEAAPMPASRQAAPASGGYRRPAPPRRLQ